MGCAASSQISSIEASVPTTVAFLGLSGTGKTTLIEFLAGEYDPSSPPVSTIGTYIREIHIANRAFIVFDTCGLISHLEEWVESINKAEAIVFVFDPVSIDFSSISLAQMFKVVGPAIALKKIPVLVIMTKTKDLDCQQFLLLDPYLQEYFNGVNYIVRAIHKPDQSVYDTFQWIMDNTIPQIE